jgi:predicted DNA binding CopG/RHH family protein
MNDWNREVRVAIRFNQAEIDALAAAAKAKGISLSAAIRELVHREYSAN